ncbi:hypothetical protein WJX72_011539 [[Myrmecia] bisecta]|uniref:PLOD1-3-like GT domain-containing protein n=1 Tax=[Myrmecia] bisecta TaxID=41462 RepID=A0AAW1QTK4_9CHLO
MKSASNVLLADALSSSSRAGSCGRKAVAGLVLCTLLLAIWLVAQPGKAHPGASSADDVASDQAEPLDPAWLKGFAAQPDDLEVITVATSDRPALHALQASSPYKVTVLGLGQSWEGYRVKLFPLIPYLREKHPNDLVLIVDAFDVVFLPNCGRDLVETYRQLGADIVFNAETNVWPDAWKEQYYPQGVESTAGDGPRPQFLNSGTYMGPAGDILYYLLRYFLEAGQWNQPNFDDQRFWTDIFLARQYASPDAQSSEPSVALDLDGRLFQLLNPPSVRAAWTWNFDPIAHQVSTPDGPYAEAACILHGPSHKADFWDIMYARLEARKDTLYSQQMLDDYDEQQKQGALKGLAKPFMCKVNPFGKCL